MPAQAPDPVLLGDARWRGRQGGPPLYDGAVFHEHGPAERSASDDVEHRSCRSPHDGRIDALLEHLGGQRDLSLVFVRTKHGADKLVKKLANHGVTAVAMHGNKTQRQRERALAQFEAYQVDTLVATDVAARGIDVGGISHVINFDPPHDTDTYVHRVGRTGRAGATGVAISLVSSDQVKEMNHMVGALGIDTGLGGRPSVGSEGFRRPKPVIASDRDSSPRQDRGPRQSGGPREDGAARSGSHRSGSSRHGGGGPQRAGAPTAGRHGGDGRPGREDRPARDGKPARAGKASSNGKYSPSGNGQGGRSGSPSRGGQAGGAKRPSSKPRFKNS